MIKGEQNIRNKKGFVPTSNILQITCPSVIWYFEPLKNQPLSQYTKWYFDLRVKFLYNKENYLVHFGKKAERGQNSEISTIYTKMLIFMSYPWYLEPPTHGISNPLSMIYRTPYPWYIEPPTNGISNPPLLIKMRRFKIQLQKFDPGVKIPFGILTQGLIFQGFKISYDTGASYL
jgi:hypothetical protein